MVIRTNVLLEAGKLHFNFIFLNCVFLFNLQDLKVKVYSESEEVDANGVGELISKQNGEAAKTCQAEKVCASLTPGILNRRLLVTFPINGKMI